MSFAASLLPPEPPFLLFRSSAPASPALSPVPTNTTAADSVAQFTISADLSLASHAHSAGAKTVASSATISPTATRAASPPASAPLSAPTATATDRDRRPQIYSKHNPLLSPLLAPSSATLAAAGSVGAALNGAGGTGFALPNGAAASMLLRRSSSSIASFAPSGATSAAIAASPALSAAHPSSSPRSMAAVMETLHLQSKYELLKSHYLTLQARLAQTRRELTLLRNKIPVRVCFQRPYRHQHQHQDDDEMSEEQLDELPDPSDNDCQEQDEDNEDENEDTPDDGDDKDEPQPEGSQQAIPQQQQENNAKLANSTSQPSYRPRHKPRASVSISDALLSVDDQHVLSAKLLNCGSNACACDCGRCCCQFDRPSHQPRSPDTRGVNRRLNDPVSGSGGASRRVRQSRTQRHKAPHTQHTNSAERLVALLVANCRHFAAHHQPALSAVKSLRSKLTEAAPPASRRSLSTLSAAGTAYSASVLRSSTPTAFAASNSLSSLASLPSSHAHTASLAPSAFAHVDHSSHSTSSSRAIVNNHHHSSALSSDRDRVLGEFFCLYQDSTPGFLLITRRVVSFVYAGEARDQGLLNSLQFPLTSVLCIEPHDTPFAFFAPSSPDSSAAPPEETSYAIDFVLTDADSTTIATTFASDLLRSSTLSSNPTANLSSLPNYFFPASNGNSAHPPGGSKAPQVSRVTHRFWGFENFRAVLNALSDVDGTISRVHVSASSNSELSDLTPPAPSALLLRRFSDPLVKSQSVDFTATSHHTPSMPSADALRAANSLSPLSHHQHPHARNTRSPLPSPVLNHASTLSPRGLVALRPSSVNHGRASPALIGAAPSPLDPRASLAASPSRLPASPSPFLHDSHSHQDDTVTSNSNANTNINTNSNSNANSTTSPTVLSMFRSLHGPLPAPMPPRGVAYQMTAMTSTAQPSSTAAPPPVTNTTSTSVARVMSTSASAAVASGTVNQSDADRTTDDEEPVPVRPRRYSDEHSTLRSSSLTTDDEAEEEDEPDPQVEPHTHQQHDDEEDDDGDGDELAVQPVESLFAQPQHHHHQLLQQPPPHVLMYQAEMDQVTLKFRETLSASMRWPVTHRRTPAGATVEIPASASASTTIDLAALMAGEVFIQSFTPVESPTILKMSAVIYAVPSVVFQSFSSLEARLEWDHSWFGPHATVIDALDDTIDVCYSTTTRQPTGLLTFVSPREYIDVRQCLPVWAGDAALAGAIGGVTMGTIARMPLSSSASASASMNSPRTVESKFTRPLSHSSGAGGAVAGSGFQMVFRGLSNYPNLPPLPADHTSSAADGRPTRARHLTCGIVCLPIDSSTTGPAASTPSANAHVNANVNANVTASQTALFPPLPACAVTILYQCEPNGLCPQRSFDRILREWLLSVPHRVTAFLQKREQSLQSLSSHGL